MVVYENYVCYGPYIRKDGRSHVVLINKNNKDRQRVTVSYPKYLVEKHLNRYLNNNETVDHIDGNFFNNDISNLRVVDRSLHTKSHNIYKKEFIKHCVICGKEFKTKNNYLITCSSPACRGACAHINGYNKGNNFVREHNEYMTHRSLIDNIVSVDKLNKD